MSKLYMTCGLCGRKQAEGILSRNAWGHLEAPGLATPLRACPTCKTQHDDWQGRLLSSVNGNGSAASSSMGVSQSAVS